MTALLFALLFSPIWSQTTHDDKTLAPYFRVIGGEAGVDQLPLQSTKASVNIAGVIADVTITQVYKNDGKKPLEAIYVFPTSTRAAVYDMVMIIGNRTIQAEIKERNQAQQEYQEAKAAGKRASLLEQERPNVFQMNVANIQAGDEIKVVLKYTEMLMPEKGVYEFVYPTVVGPRFTEATASVTSAQFTSTPYQKKGESSLFDFDLDLYLSAGLPIQTIKSPTHELDVKYEDPKVAAIQLGGNEKNAGNRDFILQYQLAGGQIESGLLLYEHEDENYFLMMVQPPKKVAPKQIPPREYVFIVDVSGSMRGFPLDISKKLLRDLIIGLRPTDRFNVMLFAGTSGWLAEESVLANEENVAKAIRVIDKQRGGGGTRLRPALEKAMNLPHCESGLSRSIVVVTDGYISVEQETFDLIRNRLNEANLFTFGIGSSVNRHLLEGIAHVGMGEPLIITAPEGAHAKAEDFRNYISTPVLSQVKTSFKGFEVYDTQPSSVPDVLAERPILVFGKWKGEAQGSITVEGYTGEGTFQKTFNVEDATPSSKNAALRYLWAREKIRLLDDYNQVSMTDERIAEVTQLGLDYNLMTAYTSFIAVDNEVIKNENGDLVTVKQALPLPQGVDNTAVGFDGAIEGVVRSRPNKKTRPLHIVVETVKTDHTTAQYQQAKQELQTYLDSLSLCQMPKSRSTLSLTIKVDKTGRITAVDLSNDDSTFSQCLKNALENHHLFSSFNPLSTTYKFELTLKTQD